MRVKIFFTNPAVSEPLVLKNAIISAVRVRGTNRAGQVVHVPWTAIGALFEMGDEE